MVGLIIQNLQLLLMYLTKHRVFAVRHTGFNETSFVALLDELAWH